jgi:diguanylate cyclase (GGDEF)-like protein
VAQGNSVSRGLLQLIWPLLAAIALLLAIAAAGMTLLSAVRAYIGGESFWSRAQKQAVVHLVRYSENGREEDYEAYRRAIAVNFGDRQARLALDRPEPDLAAARAGFLEGRNHPDDVERMVATFRYFRLDADVERAVQAWAAADDLLEQLDALAREMRADVMANGPKFWRVRATARAVVALDDRLTPLAERYAESLNAAARRLTLLISITGGLLSLALVAGAVLMTRRTLARLQAADAQRREAEAQLAQLAHYDALTGLPNRSLFQDRLGQAIARAHRSGRLVALMFLDLDRFKEINDTLGHEAGDRVLREAAARLRTHLREGDSVARLGGDEFTVLLEDVEGSDQVRGVALKLLRAFAEPMALQARDFFVTLSIGVALYPRDGSDAETLIRHADTAMYQAKSEGRDNFQFYMPDMSVAVHERVSLEGSLRQALERGEFVLHYQPVVRLTDGEIASAEALLRWRHPQNGLVPPGRFIGVAEQTGLIVPIGEWVLREACVQAMRWQLSGLRPLRVAVNLSARQFRKAGLAESIRAALRASGLESKWLTLEITESLLMDNAAASGAVLRSLQEMGVSMALDDFGTGYSSLAYLKHFPIDIIKIDRSFVRDIASDADDAAIVRATIGLASSLGMQTTAEGVETAEQLAYLREHGCRYAQGYLFSVPLPAEEFAALLKDGRRLG